MFKQYHYYNLHLNGLSGSEDNGQKLTCVAVSRQCTPEQSERQEILGKKGDARKRSRRGGKLNSAGFFHGSVHTKITAQIPMYPGLTRETIQSARAWMYATNYRRFPRR